MVAVFLTEVDYADVVRFPREAAVAITLASFLPLDTLRFSCCLVFSSTVLRISWIFCHSSGFEFLSKVCLRVVNDSSVFVNFSSQNDWSSPVSLVAVSSRIFSHLIINSMEGSGTCGVILGLRPAGGLYSVSLWFSNSLW